MKVVWVARSFLDYRVPVYKEFSMRVGGELTVVYNADYVPERCCAKVEQTLGCRARGLRGELAFRFGARDGFANKGVRIPLQRGLVRAILDEEPDVLISEGFFQWTYAALWLRATRGIPHVMCYERTIHTERNAQWYRTAYRKWAMRWIDVICCNGRLSGEYTQSLGFPQDRIIYGNMVADVQKFADEARLVTRQQIEKVRSALRVSGTLFVYVGQLIPRKGMLQFLKAWRALCQDVDQAECALLLIGDGVQKAECQAYCGSEGIGNVRFKGAVNYDCLPGYYRCADVFVIPTLEDNWALVVPEAMACGLPIMCSKYNGCWPEFVQPANGWVFDPLDVQDTIRVLRECLDHRSVLADMGKASKAIVNNYTAKQTADAILRGCRLAMRHCALG